jgi:hypothetical protein
MSISIYYTARRPTPLSGTERAEINEITKKYSVEKEIERYLQTGDGHNWESFCIYDPKNPSEYDVVFEGATNLPDNSEDAIWIGVQHWCSALTEIRKVIPDASWDVHVDDHEIQWDHHAGVFDPSQ